MENQPALNDQKLTSFIKHAPIGLAEINQNGTLLNLNLKGETLLKPVLATTNSDGNNLFRVLLHIAPGIIEKIKNSPEQTGNLSTEEIHHFPVSVAGENIEKSFQISVTRLYPDSIIIAFDDITDKSKHDKAMLQLVSDTAVAQQKFEIAANVLHDIGNAVVGFSSYLTRIKRSLELDNSENLQNLVGFFETNLTDIKKVIGEAKADAVIKILSGIAQTQKSNQTDISKSIKEQQNIITHIQEILNIQRQYINGNIADEKKPVYLGSIINDCMSMLFASLNKRNITVSFDIPDELPVINGDRTKLMQVILNLLKNSIEAIDVYAVEKSISLNVIIGSGVLELQIRDSGKGFDEATGKKLFTRGFTTKSTGTGLGLNSCRTIIENHDGSMDITSEGAGKGALTSVKFKI